MRANAGPDMMGWVMRAAIFSSVVGGGGEGGRGEVTAESSGDGGSGGDGGAGDAAFLSTTGVFFPFSNLFSFLAAPTKKRSSC